MKEKILIVDDSALERAMLKNVLKNDYELLEAKDGEECLQILAECSHDINLILLDLVMPKVNGIDVLKQRKNNTKYCDIPVIVLTGSDKSDNQIEAFNLGANDFVAKPFDKEVVKSRIKNVLISTKRYTSARQRVESLKAKAEMNLMTGLYNKVTAENIIDSMLKTEFEKSGAMMVIDIDNFKTVNDVGGHQFGDYTLCKMAKIISSCFRKNDIVGRIGGDEFVVFMPDIDNQNVPRNKARILVEKVRFMKEPDLPDYVTLSIGLAFSEKGDIYQDLFKKCDEALQMAKQLGKDRYYEHNMFSATEDAEDERLKVAVLTENRSVFSQVESSLHEFCSCVAFQSLDALAEQWDNWQPVVIFADISEENDDGQDILVGVNQIILENPTPVFVICRDGYLAQYRNALQWETTADIMVLPLDMHRVRRKVENLNGYEERQCK